MLRGLVHFGLILTLLGCPYSCRAASVLSADGAAQGEPHGCSCCRAESTSSPSPERSDNAPVGDTRCSCPCLCNGAILATVVDGAEELVQRTFDADAPFALIRPASDADCASPVDSPHTGPPVVSSTTLCRLFETWLC